MKKIILLFIAIVISSVAFSQTAYEKKCAQIFKKYWNLFYPGHSVSNFEMNSIGVYEKAKGLLQIGALNYAMQTGKNVDAIFNQMEKEYAAARTLMTPSEKANFMVEEERKSNFGKVKWEAVLKFVKWSAKGEFEKTVEHETRLMDSARIVFDEIMYREIYAFVDDNYWHFNYGSYNADAESLDVKFEDKIKENRLTHSIEKCNTDIAKKLREGQDDDSQLQYDENSLLTDGKDFCPTKFTITSRYGEWTFDNRDFGIDLNVVKVQYDKLHLKDFSSGYAVLDKYMKGHIFDYNMFAAKNRERDSIARREQEIRDSIARREQEIRDSIARREQEIAIEQYNDKLSQALIRANDELKANKYNIKGYQIKDPDGEFVIAENSEKLYNQKMDYLKIRKERIDSFINSEYQLAKEENGYLYSSDNEFDSFYCQGEAAFKTETEARLEFHKVKKELEKNRQSIASANYQKDINMIAWVNNLKDKPYYDYVINFIINNNAGLNKEYTKNGSYFSSEEDFYEAFTSGNYKDILKSNKR